MSQQTHRPRLNIVAPIPPSREGSKTRFAEMGVGFPHKSGRGYNLVLDTLPADWERFLGFPWKQKGEGEGKQAQAPKMDTGKLVVYAPIKHKDGEILSPCGLAFTHEDGEGISILLNTLPRVWSRLVLLPEGTEATQVPKAEEDDIRF